MNKSLKQYHSICASLDFDIYLVATVVHSFRDIDSIDVIFKNLENIKLENYENALDEASRLDEEELKLLALNYGFKSENSYIAYLTSLLDLNSIFYLDYRIKEQKKESKYKTGSLF